MSIDEMFSKLPEQRYGTRWLTRDEGLDFPDPTIGHSSSGYAENVTELKKIYIRFKRGWGHNGYIVMGAIGQADQKVLFFEVNNEEIKQGVLNPDGLYYINDEVLYV